MTGLSRAVALLVGLALTASCGGSRGSGAEDPVRQIAAANERLQGSWLLVGFQPEVGLEPMLGQLLAMQIGHLSVQLDGGRLIATGIGVQARRTYRIDEASMDRFKVTLFDETGVAYEAWGELHADEVRFESLTSPWRGRGALKRLSGPAQ